MIGFGRSFAQRARRPRRPGLRGSRPALIPWPPFFLLPGREMRLSTYPVNTLRDVPADAEVVSHQLMLRASLIRRLAAGLYTWLPIGLRVLRKVERIVREEMDRAGAFEVLMPTIQPAELWQESGRWEQYGPELLRLKDRHERPFCLRPDARGSHHRHRAPRAEELPPAAGQLLPDPDQVPRRDPAALRRDARARVHDEGRVLVPPRRGLARARATRRCTAPTRASSSACSCKFRAVRADTGSIGGSASQEFHVLADSGEDAIAFSDGDDYAANLEMAEALAPAARARPGHRSRCRRSPRPHVRTIDDARAVPGRAPTAAMPEDAAGRGRGRPGRRAGRARRPRTERGQGAEAAGRRRRRCAWPRPSCVTAATGCEPGFIGPVGLALQGLRRPRRRRSSPTSSAAPTSATCT